MGIDAEMEVRLDKPINATTVRRWAWELSKLVGHGRRSYPLLVDRERGHRALRLGERYMEEPEPSNGKLIQVSLCCRYYGEEPSIIFIGAWLEAKTIAWGGRVFFGGDCNEPEGMTLLDQKAREAMFIGLLEDDEDEDYEKARPSPHCGFCAQPMYGSLSGQGVRGYVCTVCREHVITDTSKEISRAFGGWPEPYTDYLTRAVAHATKLVEDIPRGEELPVTIPADELRSLLWAADK